MWLKWCSYAECQNSYLLQKHRGWITRGCSWGRQADMLSYHTSWAAFAHKSLTKASNALLFFSLKAQMKIFCHVNSTIGSAAYSKGNRLLDDCFVAVLKRSFWRPASWFTLGQFEGHLWYVSEGCCGKLYSLYPSLCQIHSVTKILVER